MDIVNQNKFKNGLIIFLLLINLITISIIWMKTAKENDYTPPKDNKSGPESISLMKQVLNLDEEQTKQLEKLRTGNLDQSKTYNDSLSILKKQLADELFNSKSNKEIIKEKTKLIGELQAKVELARYEHLNEVLAICTPEQKEKLRPIIQELFGRKPPRDDIKRQVDQFENKKPKEIEPVQGQEERPQPPSIDEKVEKYSKRLNLSSQQTEELRKILLELRQKNENNKVNKKSNPEDFEKEKEKIRAEEDQSVIKILSADQKIEFEKMQRNKRK